jgi:hypothetical protein
MRLAQRFSPDEGSREVSDRLVDPVSKSREERAKVLEKWAEGVETSDLKPADTRALRTIAELVDRRGEVDEQITEAVISAPHLESSTVS